MNSIISFCDIHSGLLRKNTSGRIGLCLFMNDDKLGCELKEWCMNGESHTDRDAHNIVAALMVHALFCLVSL